MHSPEMRDLDRWRSSRARSFVIAATLIVAVLIVARHQTESLSPYGWRILALIEPAIGLGAMTAVVLVGLAMRTYYARWQWIVGLGVVAGIVYVYRFCFGV